MSHFRAPRRSRKFAALSAVGLLCLAAQPARAAGEADAPKGPSVSVLKATRFCFDNIVEVSGIILPREETAVRPERPGLKVAEVLVDAGETVTAGQTLARLTLPEGGSVNVQAPVAGTVSASTATIGALASGRGEALFNIIAWIRGSRRDRNPSPQPSPHGRGSAVLLPMQLLSFPRFR